MSLSQVLCKEKLLFAITGKAQTYAMVWKSSSWPKTLAGVVKVLMKEAGIDGFFYKSFT